MGFWEWVAHILTTPAAPWWSALAGAVIGVLGALATSRAASRRDDKKKAIESTVQAGGELLRAAHRIEMTETRRRYHSGPVDESHYNEAQNKAMDELEQAWNDFEIICTPDLYDYAHELQRTAYGLIVKSADKDKFDEQYIPEYNKARYAFVDKLRAVKKSKEFLAARYAKAQKANVKEGQQKETPTS